MLPEQHPARRLWIAVIASIAFHGLMAIGLMIRAQVPAPPVAAQRLIVRLDLRTKADRQLIPSGDAATVDTRPTDATRRAPRPQPRPRALPPPPSSKRATSASLAILPDSNARSNREPKGPEKAPEASASSLDLDELRAEARSIVSGDHDVLTGKHPGASSAPRNPKKDDSAERSAMPALARRIAPPSDEYVETRMTDGSRVVRFTGNRCMKIPAELPMGFKNDHGANIIVATNCAKPR